MKFKRGIFFILLSILIFTGISYAEIKNIEKNYSNWFRSHGGYSNIRFSSLDTINRSNVKNLEVAWIYNSKDNKKSIQANPVVKDGRVYFPTPGNFIVCLDAVTGTEIWKYKVKRGFHAAKRGLLLWQDQKNDFLRLIFTNDDQLITLNAKTGKPIKEFGKNGIIKIGSSPTTPTIIDEQIVIGSVVPAVEVYDIYTCLLYTSPSPRDGLLSRMPSSA